MEGNVGYMPGLTPAVALNHFLAIFVKMEVCMIFNVNCALHNRSNLCLLKLLAFGSIKKSR